MRHVSEEQLALWVGSDLLLAEAQVVEEHVRWCAECRGRLVEFQSCHQLVASSVREPSAAALLQMRRGVVAQLERRRSVRRIFAWSAALAASLALTVLGLIGRHQPRGPVLPDVGTSDYLQVAYEPKIRVSLPKLTMKEARVAGKRVATVGLRQVTLLAERDGPPMLKVTTGDPNVVIFWELGGGGQVR